MEHEIESKGAVWSSEEWVAYFESNAKRLLSIPWELGAGLTPEELALVASSLPVWQLGESSDGAHLFAAAQRYAEVHNDPAFVDAIRLFIHEEHRHSSYLGRFLDLAGIPCLGSHWGDAIFRRCRRLFTKMETAASVLVMVEVHALLYYAAIRRATGSVVLQRVCQQILRDEIPHIRFQCERLAMLHRQRPQFLRVLTLAAHRVMFTGITLAIWMGHRRALRAGGFSFARFWRTAWSKMRRTWRAMDPAAYRWPAVELHPMAE